MSSLPVTTPWVAPGPQILLTCPMHLTSVWVVCYIDSSGNLMPSSQCICLVLESDCASLNNGSSLSEWGSGCAERTC